MDMENGTRNKQKSLPERKWHRAGVTTSLTIGVLMAAALAVPLIINQTSCRDLILNRVLQKHGLTASSSASTGGWLMPFEFRDIQISGPNDCIDGQIASLNSGVSICGFLTGQPPTVTLARPTIHIALDDDGRLPLKSQPESDSDEFAFRIIDGDITLQVPWRRLPILDVEDLDIQGRVTQIGDERWLELDGIRVFDHASLSDRHTEQNLTLVAPLLSQTTSLTGEVSANLDPVRVRIDDNAPAHQPLLTGKVEIHSLSARLRKRWSKDVVQLVGRLNQAALPAQLSLASSSEIAFELRKDGIYHDGFSMLLPEVADNLNVASSGMLYLNEELDLALNIQLPLMRRSTSSFLNAIASVARTPLQLRVTGTVSHPKLTSMDGSSVLQEIAGRISPAVHTESADSIAGSVQRIIQAGATDNDATRKQKLPGQIFNLIRSIESAKGRP